MSIFSGTGVALVTPVNNDGIMYSEVDKLLSHVTAGGVDALIALGTTGTDWSRAPEERPCFQVILLFSQSNG